MFGSYRTKFQPSVARYSPLSGNNFNHSCHTAVVDDVHPEVEKVDGDNSSPSFKSRLFFALLGMLVVALVVGVIIDALGLTDVNLHESRRRDPIKNWHQPVCATDSCQLVPTTTVVFSKDTGLMETPNDKSQKSWDALIPIGRGFVNISDAEVYALMPGISTASGVGRYAVAMFHQLHCQWRLMDAMSEDWTDAARQEERDSQLRGTHSQHCFTYIAESIWCSGDLTIEWAKVEKDGRRREVDGWGIPHRRKDPEAIREWMEVNQGLVNDDHVYRHN